MRVLVIFVHPKRDGFCAQLLSNVVSGLSSQGHETKVADLHAEGFSPVFTAQDYAQFSGEPMPADVRREQERVEWSEGIVIVSPIWWYQFPAMLKGWVDRVFSQGWAFGESRVQGAEMLGWRKLLVLASAGGRPETFEKYRYMEGIDALWNVGIWGYCGFVDKSTEFFWGVQPKTMSDTERAAHLERAFQLGQKF